MALQSAYEVFRNGKGILAAIDELFVAIQELRLGRSELNTSTYCKCGDDLARKNDTAHYYMHCFRLQQCSQMRWTSDGRLLCIPHFTNGPPAEFIRIHTTSFKVGDRHKANYMRHLIHEKVRKFERGQLAKSERKLIRDTLLAKHVMSGNRFLDAYNGIRVDKSSENGLQHSVDAIFPLWKEGDEFFVHHANNVGLTTIFTNHLKCDDIPIVLASARRALEATAEGLYLPNIERMFDHHYKVRMVIPFKRASRRELASQQEPEWWVSYLRMMKSGLYDGRPPIYKVRMKCFWEYDSSESTWSSEDIARLNRICEEIESSPDFNPKGLKLPRGRKDVAPWLWVPEHMYENHDWQFLASLFFDRFVTMDTACDFANDHEKESSQTLFLTCVILWFKLDGGKDEVLGLRMTVFRRHSLRFSIGRALHVAPGSIMVTGWSAKYPEVLSQYDDARRTITMETWMMNNGKSYFTPSPAALAAWKNVILSFPRKSEFWEDYPPNYEPEPLDWPRDWRSNTLTSTVPEQDLDSTDASDDEDEDASEIRDVDLSKDDEEEQEAGVGAGRGQDLPLEIPDSEDFPDFSDDQPTAPPATGADTEHEENPLLALDRVDDDNGFLQSLAQHLPEGVRMRYESTISRWKLAAERIAAQEIERFGLFQSAITKLGIQANPEYRFYVNVLAGAKLKEWQEVEEGITSGFTEEELISFARRLEKQGTLAYNPTDQSFTYEGPRSAGD